MMDQLKKALTTGIGIALKTWDEVEALGKEMIRKTKIPEKEAASFLKGLRKNYEHTQKKFEVRVNQLVKDVLKKADVPTSDDLKALKREIQALKKELKAAQMPKDTKPKGSTAKTRSRATTKS